MKIRKEIEMEIEVTKEEDGNYGIDIDGEKIMRKQYAVINVTNAEAQGTQHKRLCEVKENGYLSLMNTHTNVIVPKDSKRIKKVVMFNSFEEAFESLTEQQKKRVNKGAKTWV